MANETFGVTEAIALTLLGDTDLDGVIDPGETVRTTVQITNNSTTPTPVTATGLEFSQILAGMTLYDQPGRDDVNVSPIVFDDTYNVIGNTTFTVSAADGVFGAATTVHLTGGADAEFFSHTIGSNPATQTAIVTTGTFATSAGGSVTLNADGSFTYASLLGFSGTDSFIYTLRDVGLDGVAGNTDDLTDIGTVTFNVQNPVWFIDSAVVPGGNGTQANPFNSIAAFNAVNDGLGNHPAASDYIYLREGSTGTYSVVDGITLLNNQVLIGQGENLVVNHSVQGNMTIETGAVGDTPVIVVTGAGNQAIQLAQGNTIRGLDVGMNNAAAVGIQDNNGTVGTLTISNVGIGVGSSLGKAIEIDGNNSGAAGTNGTINILLDSLTSSGAGLAVDIGGVAGTGNHFTVSGATTINDATTGSVGITNSSANATFTGKVTVLNDGGNGAGIALTTNTGTYSFNGGVDVTVSGAGAIGLDLQSTGTVNISDPAATTTQVVSGAGTAILVNTATVNATLDQVTSGGGAIGISLNAMSGSLTIANATISGQSTDGIDVTNSAGSLTITGGSISNPTQIGVDINNGAGNVTIGASITKSNAGGFEAVEVTGRTGGTVDFNAQINSSGGSAGIDINTNTGGTVRFDGGMNLSTGASAAFNASGNTSTTVVVTDTASTANILASTTGTTLTVSSTTIGAEGLTFQSISTNGAANGIVLSNTGTLGGTSVTGVSAAASGGTIQNTTGAGVSLTNTANVALNLMTIASTGSHGVVGTGVTNVGNSGTVNNSFSFKNGLLDSPGDGDNELALSFDTTSATNITGRLTVSNVTIQNFEDAGLILGNVSGSLVIDVVDTVFNNNSDTTGEEGIDVDASGTSNIQLNVTGTPTGVPTSAAYTSTTRFIDLEGGAINAYAQGSGILDVNISNTLTTGVGGPDNFPTPPAMTFSAEGSASTFRFDITNNRMVDAIGDGIFVGHEGTIEGRITGNAIQTGLGDGIRIDTDTSSTSPSTILIQNNDIGNLVGATGIGDQGIQVLHRDGTKLLNLTINNNRIANTLNEGIRVFTDDDIGGGGPRTNLSITNNAFSNISPVNFFSAISMGSQDPGTETFAEITGNSGVNSITLTQTPGLAGSPVATLNIEQASAAALSAANGNFGAGNVFASGTISYGVSVTVTPPSNPLLAGGAPAPVTADGDEPGGEVTPPADTRGPADTGGPADDGTDPATDSDPAASHPVIVDDGILSQAELDWFVAAAIARWTAAGLDAAQVAALEGLVFSTTDMAALQLGAFVPGEVRLDDDGAGYGWFLDPTPLDDAEYGPGEGNTLTAAPGSAAEGRFDLLSTIVHEMGHALGLPDIYAASGSDNLMFGTLFAGERRMPAPGEADGAVIGAVTHEAFAGSPITVNGTSSTTGLFNLPPGKLVKIQWDSTIDLQANKLITNPVNSGTVTATNPPAAFPDVTSNIVTTTLDLLTLGGTVWNDSGTGVGGVRGNGLKDGTEAGVNAVAVTLFADTGSTPGVWDNTDFQVATGTTASGNYSFTGLAPGEYIVRVDQTNFAGGALNLLQSSPVTTPEPVDPDDNVDNDDNGARVTGQAAYSKAITLAYNTEPTAGPGNDTNTTLDFAFYTADQEPTLGATGLDPTYTEGGPAVDLYGGIVASTVDAGQTFVSLTLTVSNVTDGPAEILSFDGSNVALTNGNAVTTATNSLNVGVTLAANLATITFSGATLSAAALQAVIDGLAYINTSQAPTDANRVVTITQLVDSGSSTPPSDNSLAPAIPSTVNVNPVNDAPSITGDIAGDVTEAGGVANGTPGVPSDTGNLDDTDVDNTADGWQAVAPGGATTNGYGTYALSATGVWTYTLNDSNAVVQALNGAATLTDTFTALTDDGTGQLVTITIHAQNDAATITGDGAGNVTEAGGVANGTAGTPTDTGDLNATDFDNASDGWQAVAAGAATTNGYGTYALSATGVWTYTLDDGNATVQGLNGAATLLDSFTALTDDGTSQLVTVTIHAQNDAAAITGDAAGDVTEAGGTANGTPGVASDTGDLNATDPDNTADAWQAIVPGAATSNGYGTYALSATGVWSYTLDDANPGVQGLNGAMTLTDAFIAQTEDGTGQLVTITIHAQNDAPVVTAQDTTVSGTEDVNLVFNAANANAITVADVDSGVLSVTLTVLSGTLTLAQTTGLAIGAGTGTGDVTMTFSGTAADINAALDGLVYRGNLNYEGGDTLSVLVGDGLAIDSEVIAIALADDGEIDGSGGNDIITGTPNPDYFDLSQGGNDTVFGLASNDAFFFGAAFTGADTVDGGAGNNDQIGLLGDYTGANALVLQAGTITGVEVIAALPGFDYDVTTADANVPNGGLLTIYGNNLGVGDNLTVDGSLESNGEIRVFGGRGTDTLTGGSDNDGFYFGPERFSLASDRVDGGGGSNDQFALNGDYAITLDGTAIQNIEVIALLPGKIGEIGDLADYDLVLDDTLIGNGATMTVWGVNLETVLEIDGSGELDGNIRMFGGTLGDTLIGGDGDDWFLGGLGADQITGGAGADTFFYQGTAQSLVTGFDRITGFEAGDRIDLPFTLSGLAGPLAGSLTSGTRAAQLEGYFGAGALGLGQAGVFNATGGDDIGRIFLVIDANGTAGYQAAGDFLIELVAPATPIDNVALFI